MTPNLPVIIQAAFALLLSVAMVATAVIAQRGSRFWGTWMMFIGAIGSVFGTITTLIGSYFLFRILASSSASSSNLNDMERYSILSGVGSLISSSSLLIYLIGILGLAVRYGSFARRITDLETINASLISQNEQTQS